MSQILGDNLSQKDILRRFRISVAIVVLAAAILAGRLYQLQIYEGEAYSAKSLSNFVQFRKAPAPRGIIYDRNGVIIADSRPSFEVYITPAFCKDLTGTLKKLDEYLELTLEEFEAARGRVRSARGLNRFRPQLIKSDIDREVLARILFYINELEGVNVFPKPHRRYRFGPLAGHVLGYVNQISKEEYKAQQLTGSDLYERDDYVGRGGIEEAYETVMHPISGELKTVVDAKGKPMDEAVASLLIKEPLVKEPKSGDNVHLTLDIELQQAAEEAFDKAKALTGAMIVLDPRNGDVLVHVSRPETNPNELSGRLTKRLWHQLVTDPYKPLLDRAIQATYPPGSTFKALTAFAILAEGAAEKQHTAFCPGYYNLGSVRFRCWKDAGHGAMNLINALKQSCDVYFYTFGYRLGTPKMMRWAEELGLGKPLGIDLPNERPGVLPTVEWHNKNTPGGFTEGQTVNQSIGQGALTANALQLAVTYATIANGGTVYRPRYVTQITDNAGKVIRRIEPVVLHKIEEVPPEVYELVNEGLKAVMNEPGGTAYYRAKSILPKDIIGAGKTGTAQVVRLQQRKPKDQTEWHLRDHALFVTYLPADDPEIVVSVIHEHGGSGSSDAAPIALEFARRYFERKRELN